MRTLIELICRRRQRRPAPLFLVIALLAVTMTIAAIAAERPAPPPAQPSPADREIYIPEEDLHLLLQSWPSATMISREEFTRLLAANAARDDSRPPRAALLSSARHRLVVAENRAFWSCQARADVLAEGQHALALPTAGIVWTHLASKGQPLPASAEAAGTGVSLLLNGPDAVELICQGELPVSTDAATRTLTLTLPPAAVATLDLDVPGDVAMRSGPTVLSRNYDAEKNLTHFELNPPLGPAVIVLTLNNRFKQSESLIYATASLASQLLPAGEQLQAAIDFDIRHQPAAGCQVLLPAGFELIDVTSSGAAALSEWSLSAERVLSMRFISPQQGRVTVRLSLFRAQANAQGPWSFPVCRPLGCQQVCTYPSVAVHPTLNLSALLSDGVLHFPITRPRPLPQPMATAGAPTTALPRVSAFAPGDFSLSGIVSKKAPALDATLDSTLAFGEDAMSCHVAISLRAELEACFQIALAVPTGWLLANADVRAAVQPDLDVAVASQVNEQQQLIIRFPNGIWPDQPAQLALDFTYTPPQWHDAWDAPREQPFPQFRVLEAREQQGTLALRPLPHGFHADVALAERCLAARATDFPDLQHCLFVYSYRDPSCRLSLSYRRATPRLKAETYSLFQVHSDYIAVTHELQVDIDRAPLRELSFLLPAGTPAGFSVVSARPNLPGVKDYSQQDSADGMLCKVILDRETTRAHLLIAYQLPFRHDGAKEPLPLIRAQGVAYQSGRIAVEGGAELDVSVNDPPRKIDVGELAPFVTQPGKRLLGVYAYTNELPTVTLDSKRQAVHPLPACLTATCNAVMALSPRGVAQLAVTYALHPNLPAITLRLPEGAVLWAVTLDGQPATAQRASSDAREVLLPMPPPAVSTQAKAQRQLAVIYELPTAPFALLGRAHAALPELCYHGDDSATRTVPTADLHWRLYFPENYRLLAHAGSVSSVDRQTPAPIAPAIGRFLYRCTGGLNPAHGCIGILLMPALSSARSKAMAIEKIAGADYMVADENERLKDTPAAELAEKSEESHRRTRRESKKIAGFSYADADADSFARDGLKADWLAAEATRSLDIAIVNQGSLDRFRSLGDDPRLSVNLINAAALRNVTRALALLLICCGLLPYFQRSWRRKLAYVAAWLLFCSLVPCIPALAMSTIVLNELFIAALVLLAVYACVAIAGAALAAILRANGCVAPAAAPHGTNAAAAARSAGTALLVLLLVGAAAPAQTSATTQTPVATQASAQESVLPATIAAPVVAAPVSVLAAPQAASPAAAAARLPRPVQLIAPEPLPMPADAVIVPYRGTPASPTGNLLLPYGYYQQLLTGVEPPRPGAQQALFSAAQYRAVLGDDDSLRIEATLYAHVPAHGPNALPLLRYTNAIPGDLAIDGRAATAWLSEDDGQQAMGIYLAEAGSYKVTFTLRTPVTRQGGWRCAAVALPAPGPAALRFETAQADCEVVFKSPGLSWTQRCTAAGSVLDSASDGALFNLQWRTLATRNEIDPTLVAQSAVHFTITEGALDVFWQPRFQFQNQDRSIFDVEFPASYRLKALEGKNVRGWESRAVDGRTRVSVHLLKPAVKEESFALRLTAAGPGVHPSAQTLQFPDLTVPGAARHHVSLLVNRQCGFEVRTDASAGVSRIEPAVVEPLLTDMARTSTPAPPDDAPVLPPPDAPALLEAWQFSGVAAPLRFHIAAYAESLDATLQLIWQLTPAGRNLEGRLTLKAGRRFQPTVSLRVPGGMELYAVRGRDLLSYHVAPTADGAQLLELQLNKRRGLTQETELHFAARANDALAAGQSIALPQVQVLGAASQHTDLAIQCPPIFQLHDEQLDGMELVLRDSFSSWLPPAARALTTLALRARNATYQGRIAVRQKDCVVTGFCLSSYTFTPTALEESVLFDLRIDGALPEFSFTAEAHLAEAHIDAPALRSQRIEPIADGARVRFTLVFQDAISGTARILLRHDRQTVDAGLPVTVPQSDVALKHYLIIENRGRDEISTSMLVNATPLDRSRQVPPILQPLLKGNNLQFFDLKDASASLLCTVKARQTVSTAGARIGLASSLLMLDPQGRCRGELTLHVDNRTEQFLVITLPAGATLWTAKVAGELIKPVIADDQPGNRVWIPLVKTAEGDLDYQIVLKYSAVLPPPGLFHRTVFPLIKVDNINVERSQLSLRLPREYRWLDFRGAYGDPVQADSYQAIQLDYQGSVAKRLNAALQSSDKYTQMRAMSNISGFNAMVEQSQLSTQAAMPQEALQQTQQAVSILNQQLDSISQLQNSQRGETDLKSYFSTLNAQQSLAFANGSRQTEYQFQLPLPAEDDLQLADENTPGAKQEPAPKAAVQTRRKDAWSAMPPPAKPAAPAPSMAPPAEIVAESEQVGRGITKARTDATGRRRLERQVTSADGMGGMGGDMGMGMGAPSAAMGMGGGMIAPSAAAAPADGLVALGGDMGMGGAAPGMAGQPAPAAPTAGANLASLDVVLPGDDPGRWQTFFFSAPRDASDLRCRAVSSAALTGLRQFAYVLLTAALLGALVLVFVRRGLGALPVKLRSRSILLQIAAISIIFGIFPVLGLALLIVSFFVPRRQNQENAAM